MRTLLQWGLRLGCVFVYFVVIFTLGVRYHSEKVRVRHERAADLNVTISSNLTDAELMITLLQNPAVRENADKLIRIGHTLEEKNAIIPPNRTVDYNPDKGDIVLPGGIYHDLEFKFPWQRKQTPKGVNVTQEMARTFEKTILKFSSQQLKKQKKHKQKEEKANMYTHNEAHKPYKRWHNSITQFNLYQGDDPVVDEVLEDLRSRPYMELYQHEGGTQMKLVMTLDNGARTIFKPMRHPRNVEAFPDHFVWADYERHISEIAAFNLDRVLGFHRVPPVTGRIVNVTEIKKQAPKDLRKTFFVSPAGNLCFYGECYIYCDSAHGVCGRPELLEGSMMAYLPSSVIFDRESFTHPWKRSYSKHGTAKWQHDPEYCDEVRTTPPHDTGRRLLDIMDMAAFDFLQGNIDRHSYHIFEDFGNNSFTLLYDNGRGFGKSFVDDMLILAPVYQCCLFRYSTLEKLWRWHEGPEHLSDAMRKALSTDPVAPVLLERHLLALDRRINIILKTVYKCIEKNSVDDVIIVDGF